MSRMAEHALSQYPNGMPGFKRIGTSSDAAQRMKPLAHGLKARVLEALSVRDMTPDEVAMEIGKTPFSVRPRLTELVALGLIEETGARRQNASKHNATVYRIKPEGERQ